MSLVTPHDISYRQAACLGHVIGSPSLNLSSPRSLRFNSTICSCVVSYYKVQMQCLLCRRIVDGIVEHFKAQSKESTPFIICLEVEVSCVLVWAHAHWLGQKQNTQNLYLQADDKRCRECTQIHSIKNYSFLV